MSDASPVTQDEAAVIEGVFLKTPKARKIASATIAVAGIALMGVAQTVNTLAARHIMPPDPVWLQVTWQWFALVAAAGGFTWNANVR